MPEAMRTIHGKCHCGNIDYTLIWPNTRDRIAARACGCTFCRQHHGVYASHPDARLTARVADAARVNRYTFGTRTADFYVCSRCGVVPFVTSTIDDTVFAVVNVNTFANVDSAELVSSGTDFDGENVEQRLERRKRKWIPHVSVEIGDP